MPILFDPRHEAFAQALARGLSALAASREAGFSSKERSFQAKSRAANKVIAARVAEIKLATAWGGDAELAEVFHELMRLAALAAGKEDSAASLSLAKGLLTEAGRLRSRLPPGVGAAAPVEPVPARILPPVLTTEQWIEAFAPKR